MPSNKKLLQAAAGNAGGDNLYVEDVFSTYLYTGNGSTQTINNGIALSDEGGLVWLKNRGAVDSHALIDTVNGPTERLSSNSTDAGSDASPHFSFPAAGNTGFNLLSTGFNSASSTWASWSFRKAKKFFDVVTYTGNGDTAPGQTVAHNLGSTPGFIIIKRTDSTSDWSCYHSGLTSSDYYLKLNNTTAETEDATVFPSAPTDSNFYVRADRVNASGGTFVAYLFASDAGGFGDDGDENIIKCGSYTGNGSADGPTINCGFEPQWLLIRNTSGGGNWVLMDAMRGMPVGDEATVLLPNANGDESGYANLWGVDLQATGFKVNVSQIQINESGGTMVYIAIRRPMKTPESGTEVFDTILRTGTGSNATITGMGFTPDLAITKIRTIDYPQWAARLTNNKYLKSSTSDAESTGDLQSNAWDVQEGLNVVTGGFNSNGDAFANWFFRRATGFFDVVAYSGDGTVGTINHNLKAVPELIIFRARSASSWQAGTNFTATSWRSMFLNLTNAGASQTNYASNDWFSAQPTSTTFSVGSPYNGSGTNYIAYLFATLDGVSKVGSYTGTGSNVDVDCGFSAGARFILIKRTDSSSEWYVWDSERGIVAGNDPFLLLNSTDAEVTSNDYIDPLSSGFTVTSQHPDLNASGGSYIFLAIA